VRIRDWLRPPRQMLSAFFAVALAAAGRIRTSTPSSTRCMSPSRKRHRWRRSCARCRAPLSTGQERA